MTTRYENDVLGDPANVDILYNPSVRATALATWLHSGEHINVTDFNQNYAATMIPVARGQQWSGNAQHQPNVTTATPQWPKPSALANFFRDRLLQVQNLLVGTP